MEIISLSAEINIEIDEQFTNAERNTVDLKIIIDSFNA